MQELFRHASFLVMLFSRGEALRNNEFCLHGLINFWSLYLTTINTTTKLTLPVSLRAAPTEHRQEVALPGIRTSAATRSVQSSATRTEQCSA